MVNAENYLAEFSDARWQMPKKKSENPFVRYYASDMDDTPAMEK